METFVMSQSMQSELKIHVRLSVACLCNAWSDRPTESGDVGRAGQSHSYAAHNLVKAAVSAALANAFLAEKFLSPLNHS